MGGGRHSARGAESNISGSSKEHDDDRHNTGNDNEAARPKAHVTERRGTKVKAPQTSSTTEEPRPQRKRDTAEKQQKQE